MASLWKAIRNRFRAARVDAAQSPRVDMPAGRAVARLAADVGLDEGPLFGIQSDRVAAVLNTDRVELEKLITSHQH